MKASLDHIGIAIAPGSRLAKLLALLGLPVKGEEEVASEEVRVQWVPLPAEAAAHVELLTGTNPQGTIAKFIDKTKRDAIHHLCFRVGDVRQMMQVLEGEGFRFVYQEPKEGAAGCWVNFIHPSTTGGLLIELSQPGGAA